jgi:peptide/nickel transport system permease protein
MFVLRVQKASARPACCCAMRCATPVPVITVIGTGFALLISGVVVTESVFNLPGIGRLTVDAVLARDYPVIQAMILLTSGIYVAVNLLIDVAYTLLDPRIRY